MHLKFCYTGICTSEGIIHDFAGDYHIGINKLAFGPPYKYCKLDLDESQKNVLDDYIAEGDSIFATREHRLCRYYIIYNSNNCHDHVSFPLNKMKYKGKENYSPASIVWLIIAHGHYVSCGKVVLTYLPFFVLIAIIVGIVLLCVYL